MASGIPKEVLVLLEGCGLKEQGVDEVWQQAGALPQQGSWVIAKGFGFYSEDGLEDFKWKADKVNLYFQFVLAAMWRVH